MNRLDPLVDPRSLGSRLREVLGDGAAPEGLTAASLDRAAAAGAVEVAWATLDGPVGPLSLGVTAVGLVRLDFGGPDPLIDGLARAVSPRLVRLPRWTDPVRRQLEEYFSGHRTRFELGLDWRLSSGFRRSVLATLHARVAYGQITSYADLAAMCGRPRAARAVGTAMATNPLPLVVPCHRVLRSGGALGGYGGGAAAKRWLLDLEAGKSPPAVGGPEPI